MKISRLEYQKKDPNRVNVFVDDKFVAGISANDIIKLGLYDNKEINSQELSKIISDSEFGKLFNSAINFLSYRPRSEWEIRFKFRTENPQMLDKVIEKLKQINQINDSDFVNWFVDQRNTFRPKGKRALKYELLKKGVDRKLIDQIEDKSSEVELALKAVSKKTRLLSSRDKLQRFLLSRGFEFDTVKEVVEKLLKKEYN